MPRSFVQTLAALSRTLQFYWFLGHVLGLTFFVFSTFFSFFNRSKSAKYYRYSLFFVIGTYAIVIKQIHFKRSLPAKNKVTLQLLRDENIQYFLLAVVFWLSSFKIGPVSGGLYSFLIFSLFHVLSYLQNHLLGSFPISIHQQQRINSTINHFTSAYNQSALLIAANSEVFLPMGFLLQAPSLLFKLFSDPLYVIMNIQVFAIIMVFIKLRFNENKFTQTVVQQLDLKAKSIVNHPQLQAYPVSQIYEVKFKGLLHKYLGPIRIAPSVKKQQ